MNWITLTTDFTEHDGYVGVMKGVIAGIAPQARVIDLSHQAAGPWCTTLLLTGGSTPP